MEKKLGVYMPPFVTASTGKATRRPWEFKPIKCTYRRVAREVQEQTFPVSVGNNFHAPSVFTPM